MKTIDEQISYITQVAYHSEDIYTRWVQKGLMNRNDADYQIDMAKSIVTSLEELKDIKEVGLLNLKK